MASSVLVLRWLSADTVGLWQSLLLIGTYAQFIHGGAMHGLNRELPFSMGRQDDRAVAELAGAARMVALCAAALCLLGIPASWLAFSQPREQWGTAAVLVGTAAGVYRLYLASTYRAAQSFHDLARIQVVEAIATVLTVPLVWMWGYAGLAAQFVVLKLGGTLLNHHLRPLKVVGRFRWVRLKELLATGIPIFAFGYLSDIARSFPRLALLSLGGVAWVGLFAPASAVVGALTMIPASVGSYVYPQMTYSLARSGSPASLWPVARAAAWWSLIIGAPVAATFALIVPYLVARFFPAYSASIPATQWVVGAGVFIGASVSVNALASLKAYRLMSMFVAARLTLLALFPLAGGRLAGLTGVAAGMTVAYALDFIVVLVLIKMATQPAPAG